MKMFPSFLHKVDREKYAIELVDFDIQREFNSLGIPITSWGRPIFPKEKREVYEFTNDANASKIVKEIISGENKTKKLTIVWYDANIAEIQSNIQFLKDYAAEIFTEDWDCWIFGEGWILEKYHEGELIFFKK